jgi:hypothetical protein
MSSVQIIDPVPLDDFCKLWVALRTIVNSSPLSRAEKIGIMENILTELLADQRGLGISPP